MKATQDALFYSEFMASVFASVFYYKYRNNHIKYILLILWLVTITEFLGGIMAEKRIWLYQNKYSYWLYNLMFPIWKSLYLYIYYKVFENQRFKRITRFFLISYLLFVPINWIFLQDFFTQLDSYPYILSSAFITISSILYLVELLNSEKIMIFHKKLLFWISIGLLLFYAGTIPFTIVRDYYSHLDYIHNAYLIIYVLGILMYSLFTFGFIWSKKE